MSNTRRRPITWHCRDSHPASSESAAAAARAPPPRRRRNRTRRIAQIVFFHPTVSGVLVREDADGVVKWEEAVSHAGDDANRANGAEFLRRAERVHERPVHAANRRTAETAPRRGRGTRGSARETGALATAPLPSPGTGAPATASLPSSGGSASFVGPLPSPGRMPAPLFPSPGTATSSQRRTPRSFHVDAHRANSRADIFARLVSGARTRYTHPRALCTRIDHGIETVFAIRVAGRDEAPPFSRVPVPERRETIESGDVVVGGRRLGFPLSPLVEESPNRSAT